ncbi:MAG TPA: hypothetical protein VJR50_10950 [Mycobacterium sp.]|nr:hypothetical protein [Mycobacterium sp.]
MNRRQIFGSRPPRAWRTVVPAAAFMVVFGIFAAVVGLTFLSVLSTIAAPALAFVGGYFMRADETATGRRPHLPFLYVEGDEGTDDVRR